MENGMKACADCKNTTRWAGQPKYLRCAKVSEQGEPPIPALCGVARQEGGECGPDATLWEAR